jgi:hypothetical protein
MAIATEFIGKLGGGLTWTKITLPPRNIVGAPPVTLFDNPVSQGKIGLISVVLNIAGLAGPGGNIQVGDTTKYQGYLSYSVMANGDIRSGVSGTSAADVGDGGSGAAKVTWLGGSSATRLTVSGTVYWAEIDPYQES